MISIPKPCHENWDAMVPTAAGRHCASCQTEVVDFTRMNDAEVVAFLAARRGQRVCGFALAPVPLRHRKRTQGARRWLLAAVAFLSGQHISALGLPPVMPPARTLWLRQATPVPPIVVRGLVVDDITGAPVADAYVFIGGTKYGAITDEQGAFTLAIPADWELVKSGFLKLKVPGISFQFQEQTATVRIVDNTTSSVAIRLPPSPYRGYKGKVREIERPTPMPAPDKAGQ